MTKKKETKDAYVRRVVDESMRKSKRAAKAAKAEGCKCGETHDIEEAAATSRKTHDRCRDIINNRDLQIGVCKDEIHALKVELKAKDARVYELLDEVSDLKKQTQGNLGRLVPVLQKERDAAMAYVDEAREEARHKDDQLRRLEQYRTELAGKVARYKKFADRFFNGDMEVE